MRRKEIMIPAVAAAAAAVIAGIVSTVIVSRKAKRKYDCLEERYLEMMDDYCKTLEEVTDYISGRGNYDPEDFIFEEDNEDE